MKTISAALKAHYASDVTTVTTCWKATLQNGTVVAATALDRDLLIDGVLYQSSAGYLDSDVESSAELNPDNLQVEGFLASPAITDADIHSGVWDYAAIEMFEVNYLDLSMGKNILRTGTLGEVKGGRIKFTAELRGLMQAYTRTIVRLMTKDCNADLGDSRCKVTLNAYTIAGQVGSVTENRVVTSSAFVQADNYFTGGKITFASGANAGLSMEVKSFAGGVLTLFQPMPFAIAVGDQFSVLAGCNKSKEDCKTKFVNYINFRGFPDLPQSKIYRRGKDGVSTSTTVP